MKKKTEVQQVNWAVEVHARIMQITIGNYKKKMDYLVYLPEENFLHLLEELSALFTDMLPTRTKKTVIDLMSQFNHQRAFELLRGISETDDNQLVREYAKKAYEDMQLQRFA
jgi:hypothetical protein